MSGSRSPVYFKKVVNELNSILPHARHTEFKGLDHSGANNTGKPKIVAEELQHFFSKRKL
ncbi:MAG: hypothetical protein ABJB86_18365 [Bacteroidota bacterium]